MRNVMFAFSLVINGQGTGNEYLKPVESKNKACHQKEHSLNLSVFGLNARLLKIS